MYNIEIGSKLEPLNENMFQKAIKVKHRKNSPVLTIVEPYFLYMFIFFLKIKFHTN